MTDKSRKLANNQFEIAVLVPNTVPLGESRIVISRKQNEKVSPKPSEVPKEVKYDSTPYRIENDTQYIFAAQWTADKVAIINGANPKSVVTATNSQDLSIGSTSVGTDDIVDRPRELTVTSDGSRAYVVMDRSGRVAVVDPMTRQQIDTQPNTAGINPINLPSGAEGRSIVIDPRDEYAYIADGKTGSNSIYVLDINPFSPTYHQVTQTIPVGTAPSGLRQIAISSDGKKLFVTAPNGANSKIYAVNIDPKDRPISPGANPKKWNQLIGSITADEGLEGIASTVNPLAMTFTNSGKDSKEFGVLNITNNDPLSFAATTRYTNLGLGSDLDYFDVNEGVAVTVLPDASYAFVVGRNADTKFFGQELPSVDGDPRAGSNIGIIKDPLTNPQLVAATRPIPNGFATDLALSSDSKYLYASYPNLSGAGGKVYVFDVAEFVKTLTNPSQYRVDNKGRGVGLPLFNSATARTATVADFSTIPIDNINPAVSIAADFQILTDANNQYTYGVPPGSKKAPISVTNPRGLAATPLDWLDLKEPIGTSKNSENPLNPKFQWSFDSPPNQDITEVNLFVSVFDEGEGLLPWDKVVDLPDPNGNKFLYDQGLSKPQQLGLLTKPWNTSFYHGQENDFNPNRILTATWQKDSTNIGKWTFDGGKTFTPGTNTSFTLPPSLKLTAGQNYNWAVEAWNKQGKRNEEFGNFWTPLPPALNGDNTFSSVTVLTHGFKPPLFNEPGIPSEFYQMGNSIANAGIDGGGLMMKYDLPTGYWVPINKYGAVAPDFQAGLTPKTDPNYLTKLGSYIAPYLAKKQPLVLLNNWSENNESAVPDSGFTEGAADAFFTSLVLLDGMLKNKTNTPTDKQGPVLNSPLHFVGFSRGTVVNSEIIQRLGTYFPNAGGSRKNDTRDLQMTTLDPHDFNQPSLNVVTKNFGDFREPKVQVWKNVTFADNYYQTVPTLSGSTLTPAGRDIPNLPSTEDGKTAPGVKFPREGWRSDNPNPNAPLLGKPDLSALLGTNKNNPGYNNSRAGFTTDPLIRPGDVHGRVVSWYGGTSDLLPTNFPSNENLEVNPVFRRRGDGYRERLFDKDFSFNNSVVTGPARVSPWYTPESKFQHGADAAPWEGIGTGWFYSALGGGYSSRPKTNVERIPLDFDNTYDARMRGDAAVPTLFNGNFDAVFDPSGVTRTPLSKGLPGWSFHNGQSANIDLVQSLEDVKLIQGNSQPNYAFKLETSKVKEIVHNRFVVPDWGALRFDLHAPGISNKPTDNPKGTLDVTIRPLDTSLQAFSQTITLQRAQNQTTGEPSKAPASYLADKFKVDYGIKGFESFYIDVPERLRGQPATLEFKSEASIPVYLDNVFFRSESLRFGNPNNARTALNNTYQSNYLVEKPQYTVSYNADKNTPNWVGWVLDKGWLDGKAGRAAEKFAEDPQLPTSNFYKVQDGDYDFDSQIAEKYTKEEYDRFFWGKKAFFRSARGHLTPSADRQRSIKDNLATFLTTNIIPQDTKQNSGVWATQEGELQERAKKGYRFVLFAGGSGQGGGKVTYGPLPANENVIGVTPIQRGDANPNQFASFKPATDTTNPTRIQVPDALWKIVLGFSPQNKSEYPDIHFAWWVPNNSYSIKELLNYQQPINYPDGQRGPTIKNRAWKDQAFTITIEALEARLNKDLPKDSQYDFLSNIPNSAGKKKLKEVTAILPA
ncbi:DNA/RNA non-specific endonuclease [Microcoleus sp. bin38.metabat.b11b12b14.051]|uniref:DNA/RNA non-specific endonuclease n=1 Tax=Microcoleus sp. bin38.metabat.b11b12b14.051 TaxID=2742709 RepID=UPI0025ECF085|nr:DNA/RNA non-specific endonuclease [Microcoleus sp. bin38.metabat.b11b12b14.051]